MLTHEVSLSLREGSLCPSCGEGRLGLQEHSEGAKYWCPTCEAKYSIAVNRWRQKYGKPIPISSTHDTFASLEKVDSEGTTWVEFAIDVDTRSRADADRVLLNVQNKAGKVVEMYASGNKGYHIQIPFGTWSYKNPQWPNVFKALAELLDISDVVDTAIYMPRAMLRVPNSFHTVSGKRKELLVAAEHTALNNSWLELVKQAEEHAFDKRYSASSGEGTKFEFLSHFTPPCIQNLWLNGLPHDGSRHQSYLHLISFYYRRGDSENEAEQLVRDFAEEFNQNTSTSEKVRVSEAERLTRSAYRSGLGFDCGRGQSLGVCEDTCPLFNR